MSKVSKLVIKACSDNKFSSFTGEFITSINPEDLKVKSAVSYGFPNGIASFGSLKYLGSPPKLLSFSLLFDGTGIIPGSNAIPVMEQVKQLQDVAYSVHKKNNAPNYIRVIWGQIDFKGRLEKLDIVYSMFQVDGTLVRAEANIVVLEEVVLLGKGKSAAGVDTDYTKPSGASATSKGSLSQGPSAPPSYDQAVGAPPSYNQATSVSPAGKESFAPTPNGMNGAYSGAPPSAYDGGPDQVYQGSNGGGPVYASSDGSSARSRRSVSSGGSTGPSGYDSDSSTSGALNNSSKGKGGVAGNGPGGSGGGVGGGGHLSSSGAGKPGAAVAPAGGPASRAGSSHGAGTSPAGSAKKGGVAAGPSGGKAAGKGGLTKGGGLAAGVAGGAAAVAAAGGADSLRKLKANVNLMQKMKEKASFFRRLQKFLKKVVPKKIYEGGKELGKKI